MTTRYTTHTHTHIHIGTHTNTAMHKDHPHLNTGDADVALAAEPTEGNTDDAGSMTDSLADVGRVVPGGRTYCVGTYGSNEPDCWVGIPRKVRRQHRTYSNREQAQMSS